MNLEGNPVSPFPSRRFLAEKARPRTLRYGVAPQVSTRPRVGYSTRIPAYGRTGVQDCLFLEVRDLPTAYAVGRALSPLRRCCKPESRNAASSPPGSGAPKWFRP